MLLNCGVGEDSWEFLGLQVHPKGNQSWIFTGRTDAEAETPILWPPDAKNWLIWKDPDAGNDWRQEKGMADEEMVGWHHRINGHEFELTLGVGDGQGGLVCCSSWVTKSRTWLSDWTELKHSIQYPLRFGLKLLSDFTQSDSSLLNIHNNSHSLLVQLFAMF